MNILLTNDDGIRSEGLKIMALLLAPRARIWACAPLEQQSGCGHGITVREHLLVRDAAIAGAEKAWSVDGKPADCVKIALLSLLPEPVDLVISGINEGANLGTDTLYSGTVAGAMEGALGGLPAIALSLAIADHRKTPDYGTAAEIGAALVKHWEAGALPIEPGTVLNVNIPDLPMGEIRGFLAARLGIPRYSDAYMKHGETEEHARYSLKGDRLPSRETDQALGTVAIDAGYVTLTPLTADMTHFALLPEIRKFVEKEKGI